MFTSFIIFVPPNQTWKVGKKESMVTILQVKNQGLEQWTILRKVTVQELGVWGPALEFQSLFYEYSAYTPWTSRPRPWLSISGAVKIDG